MSLEQHAIENGIATTASHTTYVGAGTTVTGWLLSSEFAMAFGLFLGTAGFLVNSYYKWKQDKREQVEHELRVAAHIEAMHVVGEDDLP